MVGSPTSFGGGFDAVAVGLDETLELLGGRERGAVAGNKEFVVHARRGELHLGVVFVAAQDDAHGRLFIRRGDVFAPPVEIKIHLPGVAVFEGPDFQIQQHVAAEVTMVKDEVNVVVLVAHGDAALAGFKQEAGAEFEEEFLEMVEQGGFEIALGVFGPLAEAGEFKNVGIANEVFDGLRLLGLAAFSALSLSLISLFGEMGDAVSVEKNEREWARGNGRARCALKTPEPHRALVESIVIIKTSFLRMNDDQALRPRSPLR